MLPVAATFRSRSAAKPKAEPSVPTSMCMTTVPWRNWLEWTVPMNVRAFVCVL